MPGSTAEFSAIPILPSSPRCDLLQRIRPGGRRRGGGGMEGRAVGGRCFLPRQRARPRRLAEEKLGLDSQPEQLERRSWHPIQRTQGVTIVRGAGGRKKLAASRGWRPRVGHRRYPRGGTLENKKNESRGDGRERERESERENAGGWRGRGGLQTRRRVCN